MISLFLTILLADMCGYVLICYLKGDRVYVRKKRRYRKRLASVIPMKKSE